MHIFDVLEVWVCSVEEILNASGVILRFDRSPIDRPNPSCSLNLRYKDHEADLLVWESGEAELAVGKVDGEVSQMHFDDVRNLSDLSMVLSRLADFIALSQSK